MQANNQLVPVRTLLFLGGLLLGLLSAGLIMSELDLLPSWDLTDAVISTSISPKFAWHLSRASGTVAYLLLTGSMAWGLVLSTKIVKEVTPAPLSLAMHNVLSWVALSLVGLHVWLLLLDTYYIYLPSDLLVPFTGPYRPGWVGLGTLSLYLTLLLSASFGWRKVIGQKGWRMLHALSFPVFIMVTLHGLMAGTDSSSLGMRILYAGSGLLILFLTNYRLLVTVKRR